MLHAKEYEEGIHAYIHTLYIYNVKLNMHSIKKSSFNDFFKVFNFRKLKSLKYFLLLQVCYKFCVWRAFMCVYVFIFIKQTK